MEDILRVSQPEGEPPYKRLKGSERVISEGSFKSPYYRPQTKFAKVMFSQVSVCPKGTSQHALGRGCLPRGCLPGGCLPGECLLGARGRHPPETKGRHPREILRDTVNKRMGRIPLECNLVEKYFKRNITQWIQHYSFNFLLSSTKVSTFFETSEIIEHLH